MGFVASVNFFIALFYDTGRRIFVWRIWLILLTYFLFHWLILYAHYKFYSPFFFGLIEPWVRAVNPLSAQGFIHYPGQFLMLPYFFGWAKFLLSIPVEGLVLGTVAVLIYRTYSGHYYSAPASAGQWLYIWAQLVLAWLAVDGVIVLVNTYLPEFLSSELHRAPRRIMVFTYLFLPGVHVVVMSLLYFVIAYAAIRQVSFFRAVRLSLRNFVSRPLTCLFLAATILVLPIIVSSGVKDAGGLADRFQPEAVYVLLLGGLAIDMIVKLVWMGTAVRFILDREY